MIMNLQFWLRLQRDILEMKGSCKLYAVILFLTYTIRIFTYSPFLENLQFFVINCVGFVMVVIVLAVGKCDRNKKESRILSGYCILLFIGTTVTLFRTWTV